jgi:glycerate kinase
VKILIGPDSFKDSVSASEFCQIAKELIRNNWPEDEVITVPLADGGEGTVESLVEGTDGRFIRVEVLGPLGETIEASYGLIQGDVAVIEMAEASGLPLVPVEKRNPMYTTTYGTGQLIKDAIHKGCKKIIIGIGGSATNDGGIGMLQALGYQCLDENGQEVPLGGQALMMIRSIIPPSHAIDVSIEVACDVNNPLYGENGAAYVYGPQKGADPLMVKTLDEGLRNYAKVIASSLAQVVDNIPGSGAAGGLGAGLTIIGGILSPGFEIIRKISNLDEHLSKGIDLVITSEGQMNHQSLYGKLPVELAKLAKKKNIPTIAIVGARDIQMKDLKGTGIIGVYPIAKGPTSLEESMKDGKKLIKDTLEQVLLTIHAFK